MDFPIMKRFYNTQEVADYIGVSKWTIYDLVTERRIPFIPVGKGRNYRFDVTAIDEWMSKKTIKAAPPSAHDQK